jgi:hypothetical protein
VEDVLVHGVTKDAVADAPIPHLRVRLTHKGRLRVSCRSLIAGAGGSAFVCTRSDRRVHRPVPDERVRRLATVANENDASGV